MFVRPGFDRSVYTQEVHPAEQLFAVRFDHKKQIRIKRNQTDRTDQVQVSLALFGGDQQVTAEKGVTLLKS